MVVSPDVAGGSSEIVTGGRFVQSQVICGKLLSPALAFSHVKSDLWARVVKTWGSWTGCFIWNFVG